MQVVELGKGKWTVCAICDANGDCPILEAIAEWDAALADAVLNDLQEYIPDSESKEWFQGFSKQLRGYGKLNEFRWLKGKGGTPRIYWFFDAGRLVICARAELKKGKNDPEIMKAAEKARAAYFAAKEAGDITVVPYEDTEN